MRPFFLFLFISFLFTTTSLSAEQLPQIQIQGDSSLLQNQRANTWSIQNKKSPTLLNSPQIEDSLNSLNGVQMRSQGSPTFSIRGSAQSGRTLILYNDIPLNFASSFGAPRIFLPKELIDSISVVKGPASLFYGSQAMAGSINFTGKKYLAPSATLTISDTDESFLPGRDQSLSHNNVQLATPLYQNKYNHWQASYFNEKDDGQFPYQLKETSGVREFNSQNLNRLVINGRSYHKKFKFDFDSIIGKQIVQSPGPTTFILNTREETDGLLVSITPHYFFSDQQSIKSKLSYLSSRSDFLESSTISSNDQATFIYQNEYVLDIGQKTTFHFYADFFSHTLDNSFVGRNLSQNQVEAGPLFEFYLFENLKHQLGGRYIGIQNQFSPVEFYFLEQIKKQLPEGYFNKQDQFLPSLINQYQFEDSELWLSYSQGFKNPTLTDLFSQSPFFQGNPLLNAEESEQFELGYKIFSNTSTLPLIDVRVFQINYDNFIDSFELTPGVFSRQNKGQGYSRGLDFEVSKTWSQFNSYFSYNFLDTKSKTDGTVFRLSPKHQVSWGGQYDFQILQLEIQNSLWFEYYDMSNNQNVRLEDWQQWNFLIHTRPMKNLKLSFGLINAFNEGKELTFNYPEPQRKYWLQFNYSL